MSTRTDRPARVPELVPEVIDWADTELLSNDPLQFPGYAAPGPQDESVRVASIVLAGQRAVWIDCDFARCGGTMGVVAGERVVRAFDTATATKVPVVATVSSGGARLQEGMAALLQMPRTVAAASRHRATGQIYVAYLKSPVTGGVYASWVSAADLRAAEPGAIIGFGGPRVVQEVTGIVPPADSHTAESALRHGLIDAVVEPERAWEWIASAIDAVRSPALELPDGRPRAVEHLTHLDDAYEQVRRCRSPQRPSGLEWAAWITSSWVEIAGSDPSVRAGLAVLDGRRVVVVAMDRHARRSEGVDAKPGPEAFRLAQRAVRMANRLGVPVVTLVDTAGADPSPSSEAAGIAREISGLLLAMAELATPSLALVVGEGGSGGAMAFSHADRLFLLAGAVFSVIGPEPGAAILYRDADRAPELARDFRLTPGELLDMGVVSQVLEEDPALVRLAVADALNSDARGGRDARPDGVTARALTYPAWPRRPFHHPNQGEA